MAHPSPFSASRCSAEEKKLLLLRYFVCIIPVAYVFLFYCICVRVQMIVATDVAARGLDIPGVDMVFHYRLPNEKVLYGGCFCRFCRDCSSPPIMTGENLCDGLTNN